MSDEDYEAWAARLEAEAWEQHLRDEAQRDTILQRLVRRRGEILYSDLELERERNEAWERERDEAWQDEYESWERRTR